MAVDEMSKRSSIVGAPGRNFTFPICCSKLERVKDHYRVESFALFTPEKFREGVGKMSEGLIRVEPFAGAPLRGLCHSCFNS